jgi:hypothetical protein
LTKHVHLEKIGSSLWRISIFVDLEGLMTWLRMFRGRGVVMCETVVEHGHLRTKATDIDAAFDDGHHNEVP